MNIHVQYWNEGENKGTMQYWTSFFLGHTQCDDLVAAFHNGVNELEETNMIQISMDGPNINLKLLSEVQNECQKNKLSSLIDIGSWDLHKILKGASKLLHDSPARQEDYSNLTGSDEYRLQFCGTRWVEDKKVAERLVNRNSIILKELRSQTTKSITRQT